MSGGEVVTTVYNNIISIEKFSEVILVKSAVEAFDYDGAVYSPEMLCRFDGLALADFIFGVEDLSLEVVQADSVVVDESDGAHSCCSKIEGDGRTQSSHSDYCHFALLHSGLTLCRPALQSNLSLVSIHFT